MKIRKVEPTEEACVVCKKTNHGVPCMSGKITTTKCINTLSPREYPDYTDEE